MPPILADQVAGAGGWVACPAGAGDRHHLDDGPARQAIDRLDDRTRIANGFVFA
jgi:hypothetical protein